jgi:hypothetical protein
MQKIEVHSTAESAEDRVDAGKVSKSQYLRPSRLAITAAALAAGLLVQTPGFTQVPISTSPSASTAADAPTMSGPEKAARQTWRAVMRNTPLPGKGCFHVSYPNVAWESVECKEAKPRAYPSGVNGKVGAPGAGDGTDYVAQAQGLISFAAGKFFISGVTSETNVNTPGNTGGIMGLNDGSNEYSLQLNTNNLCASTNPAEYCVAITTGTTTETYIHTAACGDYGDCHVWQQFMYATDYNQPGEAALFMQYWLYNWVGNCPKSYWGNNWVRGGTPFPGGTCFKNSSYAALPDIPVTNLGDVILSANASNGGDDIIWLEYADDSWSVTAEDSSLASNPGLDIASVWNQAEFNVVGDMNMSEAKFNNGAEITVLLAIDDGSQSAPSCLNNVGTTGETNNMTLGTCLTGVGTEIHFDGCGNHTGWNELCIPWSLNSPYIEFTESDPVLCLACGPGRIPGPPPPIEK